MKYVNPGVVTLFTECTASQSTSIARINLFDTGYVIENLRKNIYQKIDDTAEVWLSYDFVATNSDYYPPILFVAQTAARETIASLNFSVVNNAYHLAVKKASNTLYTSDNNVSILDEVKHNIEIHLKTGENGRIDVWLDTKLFMSYRSPTDFVGTISFVGIDSSTHSTGTSASTMWVSSIIIQDTRRIGLEKFKKLTIAPATEQNMAQGSTTSYTLSGLTDAAEFSDITGVVALLQPTSRDANITTGTFALNGAEVGTVDVSSSSGKDFVEAISTVNAQTTKPWTRDDIEGKTLTLKVDGAV